MNRLNGKIAVITGGASGIGAAACRLFAAEGAGVAICDLDEAKGVNLAAEIAAGGGRAAFFRCDVADGAAVASAVRATLGCYGRIDILYNNAGIYLAGRDGCVTAVAEAVWDKVIAVNLKSVYLFCREVIPHLLATGGSIINTASSAGMIGIPNCDAYTATKGAIVQLTKSMAVEYGRYRIRVNCIAPAAIMTPMVRASNPADGSDEFDEEAFLKLRTPLRRYGTPEEVARIALFLASDEASYVNGAILPADGGITICGDLSRVRREGDAH